MTAPKRDLLLDIERPEIDWRQAATSHLRRIGELMAERDAAEASRDRWRSYAGRLESLFAPTMANDARIDEARFAYLQNGDLDGAGEGGNG